MWVWFVVVYVLALLFPVLCWVCFFRCLCYGFMQALCSNVPLFQYVAFKLAQRRGDSEVTYTHSTHLCEALGAATFGAIGHSLTGAWHLSFRHL